jgi:hypothetical protein
MPGPSPLGDNFLLYRIIRYSGANGTRFALSENGVGEEKPDAASE